MSSGGYGGLPEGPILPGCHPEESKVSRQAAWGTSPSIQQARGNTDTASQGSRAGRKGWGYLAQVGLNGEGEGKVSHPQAGGRGRQGGRVGHPPPPPQGRTILQQQAPQVRGACNWEQVVKAQLSSQPR